jgi:hypothetical protein
MSRSSKRRRRLSKRVGKIDAPDDKYTDKTRPDWSRKCEICKASPIVPVTGMCGPCTFGESDTRDGNW